MERLSDLVIDQVSLYRDAHGDLAASPPDVFSDFCVVISAQSCSCWDFDDIIMDGVILTGHDLKIASDFLASHYEGTIHDHIRECLDGSSANNAIAAYKFERSL